MFEPEAPRRPEWTIDEATRAAGRKGIAQARAALEAALAARRQREAAAPAAPAAGRPSQAA